MDPLITESVSLKRFIVVLLALGNWWKLNYLGGLFLKILTNEFLRIIVNINTERKYKNTRK